MSNHRTRAAVIALGATALLAGGAGVAAAASSATPTPSATASGGTTSGGTSSGGTSSGGTSTRPPMGDPATVSHGPGETLLTGTTAERVRAAALAKEPGATVVRVETDSQGAAYEAHLKTSAGAYVTVKLDKSFAVTAVEDGFGGGPRGGSGGPAGGPGGPAGGTSTAPSSGA